MKIDYVYYKRRIPPELKDDPMPIWALIVTLLGAAVCVIALMSLGN